MARQVELGLLDKDVIPRQMDNPFNMKEWEEMADDERVKSSRAMETFSAMVEMIDTNVGRVIEQLENDGELDNTVSVFYRP